MGNYNISLNCSNSRGIYFFSCWFTLLQENCTHSRKLVRRLSDFSVRLRSLCELQRQLALIVPRNWMAH